MTTPDQWAAVRHEVAQASGRLAAVLRTADGGARAVGAWTVAETAAHVISAATLDAHVVTGELLAAELREPAALVPTTTTRTVHRLNELALDRERERDPGALAGLLRRRVDRFLELTAGHTGTERVEWLGGAPLSVAAVFGHLLTELLVHGVDIARAERRELPVPPEAAALCLEVYLFDLFRHMGGTRLGAAMRAGPVAAELRIDGTTPVVLVSDGHSIRVDEPGGRRVDVRVIGDPATTLLVIFGRTHPLPAVLRRGVSVRGPRPWRLRQLLTLAP